jgi:hypothetical protein
MLNPNYCPQCRFQLCKVEVVNVKTQERMGHYWVCYDCEKGYVGFGNPDEYDGTPKPAPVQSSEVTNE